MYIYVSCHNHANNIFFQILWTPYRAHNISRLNTIDVLDVSGIVVPLICFSTVELHQANRVMRQFGLRQPIPDNPLNLNDIHKDDMRGRTDRHWLYYHQKWIAMWNDWHVRLIQGQQFGGNGHLRDIAPYMQWYISRTIRYITPQQASMSDEDVSSFPIK